MTGERKEVILSVIGCGIGWGLNSEVECFWQVIENKKFDTDEALCLVFFAVDLVLWGDLWLCLVIDARDWRVTEMENDQCGVMLSEVPLVLAISLWKPSWSSQHGRTDDDVRSTETILTPRMMVSMVGPP